MTQTCGLNILIADDCPIMRDILRTFLLDIADDVTLIEAEDGAATLSALVVHEIDIVFLDVNMPKISGLDALKLLRKKGDDVFVTLMSADADDTLLRSGSELGSYDFLKKPITKEQVAAILTNYQNLSQRKKVLIVDDSITIRHLIGAVLVNSRFDMLISEVDSGNEAIKILKAAKPDIVFLDFHMPGLNGIEAAHKMRAANPNIKLVLISGKDLSERLQESRDAGIFAFINKPFFPNEVDFVMHRLYGLNTPQLLEKTPNVTLL